MLYGKTERVCRYGKFNENKKGGYTVTDGEKLTSPWYYIYQNRKILLYVDQNGPVKIQHRPPSGILLCKRELGETQSKWQVWIQSNDINGGVPVSNFNSPILDYKRKKPKFTVNWTPSVATYTAKYDGAEIVTTIFVPLDKATVCMKTTVINKKDKDISVKVTPSVFPYINKPQMVPWDLPEWYLSVKPQLNGKYACLAAQMGDPDMIDENERSVTFNMDYEDDAEIEIDLQKYCGAGNFFAPQTVLENGRLSHKMKDADNVSRLGGVPAVFAAKYDTVIKKGCKKTFTQVMTVQTTYRYCAEENALESAYFDEQAYADMVAKSDAFYEDLFTKRTIKTENKLFDDFMNNFAPLQMYWVGSLDRGWPSSMRGTRDASQDFTGIVPLYPEWAKETIKQLFEHQRTDGWYPRQVSTISRTAPHDMRYFSDGGAFLLELVHEYMTFTRDSEFLNEKVWWLDSDEESTVLEHILRTAEFYLNPINIGEHGLCKAWYGDWWDVMDKIGTDGRGETVTVTAQNILNLKNLADMFKWLVGKGVLDEEYLKIADRYLAEREKFAEAMKKYAFNKLGYFNGYFNDNGKWLLSDNDPDGKDRLYLVANAWAIISGITDEKMNDSILDNIEKRNFKRLGYHTQDKAYLTKIDKAGRVGNGTHTGTSTYNHAQSFLVRACCAAGRPDMAYKATRYILPIEGEYAPVEYTGAPPFAIANCYNTSDAYLHRVQLQFLSGTVSYVLRNVYSYFLGITYGYDGLTIQPCLPKEFGDCTVTFEYLDKHFTVNYVKVKNKKISREPVFIPDGQMKKANVIKIEY